MYFIREPLGILTSDPLCSTVGQRFARPDPRVCCHVSWLNCSAVMALTGATDVKMPATMPAAAPKLSRAVVQDSTPSEVDSGSWYCPSFFTEHSERSTGCPWPFLQGCALYVLAS
eukprot:TRINITY_DN8950_c0_g2_i4.p1 TRINITY_DN8950_c0_g2~~TRINITY_DN8950_c0_g2_i4.p1  ORF type:complete len:115 (+),score=3.94 TRINITY_DN8950_c0_g2_i4:104-448(+)